MRLLRFLQDSVNDKCIFKAIFVAGSPGSGKSFVLTKIGFGSIQPRVINTDKWTEYFGKGANVDWDVFGDKVNHLTSENVFNYINGMLPLFIDSTSANPTNTINRKDLLESIGYDVGCVFVNTSIDTALKRNAARKRKVPEEFLMDTYVRVQKIKPNYKAGFKFFKEINNDVGELTDEVILKAFKAVQGFFEAPLQNPTGKKVIEQLRETGGKYLTDLPEFSNLKQRCNVWWRS